MYDILLINEIVKGKIIHNNDKSIDNFSINSKSIKNNTIFIPIKGQKYDGNDFILDAIKNGSNACLMDKNYNNRVEIIFYAVSNNISLIEVDDTLKSLHLLAHYNRLKNDKTIVIGITGSNGKTTTKELLYQILKHDYKVLKTDGNLNNHIGVPLTLLQINNHDIALIEMGMNHEDEISVLSSLTNPNIAIITNIGTAHIGNLKSKENILKAKLEIVNGLKNNGLLLINNNDQYLNMINPNNNYNIYKYGYDDVKNIEYKNNKIIFNIGSKKFKIKKIGEYALLNIILAYKISVLFNINIRKFKKYIKTYKSPKMRMEVIKYKKNIIINDSYNANYDSMYSGINYVYNRYNKKYNILLYLGEMKELGEWSKYYHSLIGNLINNINIHKIYVTGNNTGYILGSITNNSIIKKDFSNIKLDDNNLISIKKEILNDFKHYKKSVIYFKGSRSNNLNKIVDSIINR